MRYTNIVTSIIKHQEKILLLKRSNKVKTMKNIWSGVSGIIENNEIPLSRAKIEIFEEIGIVEKKIDLLKLTMLKLKILFLDTLLIIKSYKKNST